MNALTFSLLIAWAAAVQTGQHQVYQGIEEELPIEVEQQPVPFSHRLHGGVGVGCTDCHTTVETKAWASLPNLDLCLGCHGVSTSGSRANEELKRLRGAGEEVRWVRVYAVPDFVFFSHANHLQAKLTCETCHGPVQERDVLVKEVSTSMTTCMNCHTTREVPNHCSFCHSLGH